MFRKKKQAPVWENEELYWKINNKLLQMVLNGENVDEEDYKRTKSLWDSLSTQRENFLESNKTPEKKRLSPDAKLMGLLTIIGWSAPYVIEQLGQRAPHFDKRISLPKIGKW